MSVSNVFSRYAVEVHTEDDGAATIIGAITEQNIETNPEVNAVPTSGEVYPRHIGLYAQQPGTRFVTLQIARALDLIGITGKRIISTLNPGLNMYAQKWARGSTPDAGAAHRQYNIKQGVIVPRSITINHQADAELEYAVLTTYDGTNEPIVITENQNLPAGLVDDQRYTIGPFTLAGVATGQIQSLEIDFNITAETLGADSDVWDTYSRLRTISPMVRVRGTDLTWLGATNIPLAGKAALHTDTTFYLRKRKDAATFVDDATAEHIKMTADGMAVITTAQDETSEDPSQIEFELTTRFDGTNVPIVIDTASAIT